MAAFEIERRSLVKVDFVCRIKAKFHSILRVYGTIRIYINLSNSINMNKLIQVILPGSCRYHNIVENIT